MDSEKFNALGTNHRDCPRCFRVGSLTGDRADGAPMECSGCGARFTYAAATDTTLATLTRVRAPRTDRTVQA